MLLSTAMLIFLAVASLQPQQSGGLLLQSSRKATSSTIRIVDLRSDTVTRPSNAMRKVMFEAEVGDDVFGEDPTVNALEVRTASLFGKESALFFPTGTMANLAAVMSWCGKRGSEMILGESSHIHIYEQGGVSQFGGVATHILPNNADGTIDLDAIEASIRSENIHFPTTELIATENTHNNCGGKILPAKYMEELGWVSKKKNVPVHLDGARIWNAAAATQLPLAKLVESVDSVTACLSKGLGAPVGSMLIGSSQFVHRAKRLRKALGGGMRQSGILAAAGMQALDDFESGILDKDHTRAEALAFALNDIPGIVVEPNQVQTNIIMVHIDNDMCLSLQFIEELKERGVLALPKGLKSMRIVIHRDINDEDIHRTAQVFRDVAAKFWAASQATFLSTTTKASSTSNEQVSSGLEDEPVFTSEVPIDKEEIASLVANESDELLLQAIPSEEESTTTTVFTTAPPAAELPDEESVAGFEEVELYGMSVGNEGFCVLLKGSICGRVIKVPVTPVDPMVDGLDIDQVESSEAVTLLQLLQGIDMETHLPKGALASKFSPDKQRFDLRRIMIDAVGGAKDRLFSARLCGYAKKSREASAGLLATDASSECAEDTPASLPSEGGAANNGELTPNNALIGVRRSISDDTTAALCLSTNSDEDESTSLETLASWGKKSYLQLPCKEVESKIAFEAIGLALRHKATIEVKSTLLQDERLSFTESELNAEFPKLLTTTPIVSEDLTDPNEAHKKLERLHRQLNEAQRQKNDHKISAIVAQLDSLYKTVNVLFCSNNCQQQTLNVETFTSADGIATSAAATVSDPLL